MAQVEWNGIILNQQTNQDKAIVDLSQTDLTELIWDLFGTLSFIEITELYTALENSPIKTSMNWQVYFQKQQMHFNQRFVELTKGLQQLSPPFKEWCFQRKLSAQDLMPLNSLKEFDHFNKLSLYFSEQSISRNEGKKVIDLLVDLLLLDTPIDTLIPSEQSDWLTQLTKLRTPKTLINDQKLKAQNSQVWPKYVQASKYRQGDKLLNKIQIIYLDNKDLGDKLSRLNKMELS